MAKRNLLKHSGSAKIASKIDLALDNPGMSPVFKVYMNISQNRASVGEVLRPDDHKMNDSLVDGGYVPSMKFAFVDQGCKLDEGWRILPSNYNTELLGQIPWVGRLSKRSGAVIPNQEIVISYSDRVNINKVSIISDPFGPQKSGRVKKMDVYTGTRSRGNWTWTKIKTNWAPKNDEGSTNWKAELRLNDTGHNWSGERSVGWQGAQLVAIDGIKVVIKAITINDNDANARRNVLLYEIDGGIEVDITNDVVDLNVQETRDSTASEVSPIGTSNSNTSSITLDNSTNKYNNESTDSPYFGLLDANTKFEYKIGYKLNGVPKMVDYGTYYSDDWNLGNFASSVSINLRDKMKFLQDNTLQPLVYENRKMSEIVKDVLQRSGIKDYKIDAMAADDLGTGATERILSGEDISNIANANVVYHQEGSPYDFLSKLAASDLSVFYFDRSDIFIWKSKETISDPDNDSFKIKYELSESDFLEQADFKRELAVNSVKLQYSIPDLPDFQIGLWEADNPTILGSAALAETIDKHDTFIPAGNIQDWPESGLFKLDNEIIRYNSRTDIAYEDCERGQYGTKPVKHEADNSFDWGVSEHTWHPEGGRLKVTGNSNEWGFVHKKKINFPSNYVYEGTFNVNGPPYKVGFAFRIKDFNNMYFFVAKTVGEIGDEDHGTQNQYKMNLTRIKGGEMKTLKSVKGIKILTNQDHTFRVEVNNLHFELWIDGQHIMNYEEDSASKGGIIGEGFIGLASCGYGPNFFDNLTVTYSPQSSLGERVVFKESFGKPMFEIREIEANYSTGPATQVEYWMTVEPLAEIIRMDAGPFSAKILIQNKRNEPTVVEGDNPESPLGGEFFILYGNAVRSKTGQEETDSKKVAIKEHGLKEYSADLPWVQSKTHAKALVKYLMDVYKSTIANVTASTILLPELSIGDMVAVSYERLGLDKRHFHVVGNSVSISGGSGLSISQALTLRSRATSTLPETVGTLSCVSRQPPKSFYVDSKINYNHTMPYKGYTETVYGRHNTPVTSADGLAIPIKVWRPSSQRGKIMHDIMKPSTGGATGSALPAIVWVHPGFPGGSKEESTTYHLKWLQKIIRAGYVVCFVDYRGSGGHGKDFFDKEDILHAELDDVRAAATWLNGQSFVSTGRVAIMGTGRGADIALAMAPKYPTDSHIKCIISLAGTPNPACSIFKWPDGMENIKKRYYVAFDGGPHKNPNEWIAQSVRYNIDSIPDLSSGSFLRKILMINGEKDSIAPIKDVWDFYNEATRFGTKSVTAFAWRNRYHKFMFGSDGNPDKNFKDDWWLRTVKFLVDNL